MTINVERLERLAVILDGYQPGDNRLEFDLHQWTEPKMKRGGFLWLQQVECGTKACAVGLACLSGVFASEGFSAYRNYRRRLVPTFKDKENWAAVRMFFGLSKKQALRLFEDKSYPESKGPIAANAVACRIRSMIARSQKSGVRRRMTGTVEQIKRAALEMESYINDERR